MKSLEQLCRKNIWNLAPYSSARNEYAGREARVFLDANENPYNTPFNRYPDPLQLELKAAISKAVNDPERMMAQMKQYQEMQKIRNELAKKRGSEVII